jgi:glycosyltransferase involved in cell wall biosynthesis
MNLFAICDAVVVPSLCYENSPTVIYESFLAGVPVVASNIGGVGELVKDGENGFLVTPGKRDEWLAAIRKLSNEVDAWRTKSSNIQKTVEPYKMGKYIERLEKIMKETMEKKHSNV